MCVWEREREREWRHQKHFFHSHSFWPYLLKNHKSHFILVTLNNSYLIIVLHWSFDFSECPFHFSFHDHLVFSFSPHPLFLSYIIQLFILHFFFLLFIFFICFSFFLKTFLFLYIFNCLIFWERNTKEN